MDTTKLDDLLNEAEAQEGNQIEWTLDQKYDVKNFYVDEHGIVDIKNKIIGDMSKHISVKGESYSQYIEFKINRFYDGIDLTNMLLAIYYDIPSVGSDESKPINVYYNETEIKFGWAIPVEVAQTNLTIDLCVYARGKLSDGNNYILKTKTATYQINDGLDFGSNILKPTNNWYLNFVLEMDSKVQTATDASNSALNSYNAAKEAETIVLQYKQIVEEKSEVVDTQYKEIQTMHKEAEQYRDESFQFRNEAEQFSPDGYSALVEQVNKNTVKVDTIIEKADLGIQETVTGEQIHATDSANAKVREFALFGKAEQNTTTGKNLLPYPYHDTTKTKYEVTFTDNKGIITANGTASANAIFDLDTDLILPSGTYKISCENDTLNQEFRVKVKSADGNEKYYSAPFELTVTDGDILNPYLVILKGQTVSNRVLKPMIRLASITDDTYEPYTGGIPSPNPEYPQEIEVSGESYNLLENTATSKTENGITFTVNEDGSVTVNGTATSITGIYLCDEVFVIEKGVEYVITGGLSAKCRIDVRKNNTMYTDCIVTSGGGMDTNEALDKGGGASFIPNETTTVRLNLRIENGTTLNNENIYPMIRKASVKNDRYMPYGKGSVGVVSCGKNLLKNEATSKTIKGVSFVVNEDKSVKLSGTATEYIRYVVNTFDLKKGKYFLTGAIVNNKRIYIKVGETYYDDRGSGITVSVEEDANVEFAMVVMADEVCNGEILKPMLRRCDENGNPIGDSTYEPYKETLSTIPTNGLAGIKVSSGGNYTDQNGQQWICDEVVKYADGSGEKIQRIGKEVFDGSEDEAWATESTNQANKYRISTSKIVDSIKKVTNNNDNFNGVCSAFEIVPTGGVGTYGAKTGISCGMNGKIQVYADNYNTTDVTLWTSYLAENPMTLYYELAEPIRTPLTAEQIAEIEKVCTFYPVTNISNDFECGMGVKYLVDSKNYVDKKLELQAKAREEEMMAMFLLLPDEVQAAMIENDTNNLMSGMEE